MNVSSLLSATGILLAISLAWFAVHYWLNPHVAVPDGQARVVGVCGDVMEVRLKFAGGRMVEGSPWTNGCAHSFNCVVAAVDLATGKTPEEILDIDSATIGAAVGGLPREHRHCAALAAETLHAAIDNYMQAGRKNSLPPAYRASHPSGSGTCP
jgi:nitrogen fixation NifU-like protein